MKALCGKEIFGNWATLLTPINTDDTINISLLEAEIDKLIEAKVNGIYSNGTAGEFYNQTEDEFDKINQILANKCNAANMPFQIGVSHMSPIISLERLKRVLSLYPSAVQIILPDWFPPSDNEVINFLERISNTSDEVNFILYNPPHAKRKFSPEEIGKFSKIFPKLVGIKVPWTTEKEFTAMNEYCSNLSVFIPGHYLATGFSNGASGAYSNVACINPKAAQIWYDSMKDNIEVALELEKRIQTFMAEFIAPYITQKGYSNQAVDKFMAAVGGWCEISPKLRWPYESVPEIDIDFVRKNAQNIIPEFFN